MKKKKKEELSINTVWDAQKCNNTDKRKFYKEQLKKYRDEGNMELVSYYATMYENSKKKTILKEEKYVQPNVVVIPDSEIPGIEII